MIYVWPMYPTHPPGIRLSESTGHCWQVIVHSLLGSKWVSVIACLRTFKLYHIQLCSCLMPRRPVSTCWISQNLYALLRANRLNTGGKIRRSLCHTSCCECVFYTWHLMASDGFPIYSSLVYRQPCLIELACSPKCGGSATECSPSVL